MKNWKEKLNFAVFRKYYIWSNLVIICSIYGMEIRPDRVFHLNENEIIDLILIQAIWNLLM